jgi:hypothetical protein
MRTNRAPSPGHCCHSCIERPHPKMPSARRLIVDGNHDARGFTRLEDDRDSAGLSSSEVEIYEFVGMALGASTIGTLRFAAIRSPSAETGQRAAQVGSDHQKDLSIRTEEAVDPFGCWNRWSSPLSRMRSKQPLVPTDAALVVLEKGVHSPPTVVPQPGS